MLPGQAIRQGRAIIIGAGPAGLTAALELQRSTSIQPVIVEASQNIGGISRTVRYKGNRMDIGGHRFFSKSDRVMQWWLEMLPVAAGDAEAGQLRYQGQKRDLPHPATVPDSQDLVMLVRQRKSRIYFLRRFFDYPIRLTAATFRNLGSRGLCYAASATSAQPSFRAAKRNRLKISSSIASASSSTCCFQVLHREGLGCSLQGDQRRMGRTAHQEPVAAWRHRSLFQQDIWRQTFRRHRPEGNRDLAH